jgi:lipopolysaccharide export system protein LptA
VWLGVLAAALLGASLPARAGEARGAAPAAAPEAVRRDTPAAPTPDRAGRPARVAQADAGTERRGPLTAEAGQPLSIQADELEAVEEDGVRRLRFTRGVHVQQGQLSVHSDRLEAFYPKDAEQPERLQASGHVRVKRLERELACDSATYYRTEERLVCTGNAELREGEDRVRGRQIEIFFGDNRVRVSGGAVVNVTPERKSAAAEGEPVSTGPGTPGTGAAR